jgi:hypothetical protein
VKNGFRHQKMTSKTKTMKNNAKLTLIFLLAAGFLSAQDENFNETQVVTGVRENVVKSAVKLSDNPALVDTTIRVKDIKYDVVPRKAETVYQIDTIKAANLKMRESLDRLYNGYAKAGIGLYTTPFAEIRYNSTRSRKMAYGAMARHFSSAGGLDDVARNSYSDNEVDVWGRKFFNQHEGSLGLNYERNMVHFYGFNPADFNVDKNDIKQIYNYVESKASWRSFYRDSTKINHIVDARYYHFANAFDGRENNLLIEGKLTQYIKNDLYTLDVAIDYNNYKRQSNVEFPYITEITGSTSNQEELTTNSGIVKLRPQIMKRGARWHALVGLGIYAQLDNTARFHFYPDAEIKYSLFDNMLVPYAGLTGRLERNSFRTLTEHNPFLLPDVTLFNSSVDYELYGGFRGRFSREISFNAGISASKIRDYALFVNDVTFSTENRFDIVYDKLKEVKLFGELTYIKREKLMLSARGSYSFYTMDQQVSPWHLPNLRLSISADYNLAKKFYARILIHAENDRKALSVVDVLGSEPAGEYFSVKLKGFVDVDLGFEYRYTKRLSAFIEVKNLFATRYQRWYNYPTQRFLLMGGLSYSF